MFANCLHTLGAYLKCCKLLRVALIASVLLLIGAVVVWNKLNHEEDQPRFDSAEALFKYGSIGSEKAGGIPYWIWRVMPKIFSDQLPGPGGLASLGVPWEQGNDTPVGFSVKTIGYPRVAFNCAFCHAARYRTAPNENPTVVVPGPGHTINTQAYARYLAAAGNDARFNADTILEEIGRIHELSFIDKLIYRFLLIPGTKKALIKYGETFGWTQEKPDWGPGRIDPFNPLKFGVLQMGYDKTIGNSDMPPLWNMNARATHALHWDGLNTDLHEVVVSSAIGDGMTYDAIAEDNLQRIEEWLKEVPPPKSPFGAEPNRPEAYRVNATEAERGKAVFDRHCADCHAPSGARTGKIIPVDEVGTDRHRVDMWVAEAARRYNSYQKEHDWGMRHFQDVDGYVAVLLDAIWLRGPYLHNGSVPSIRDLLKPPSERPTVFFRGGDLLDPVNLGFVSAGDAIEKSGFRYNTAVAGNSNQGHVYGTDLPQADKDALVEFLKTL